MRLKSLAPLFVLFLYACSVTITEFTPPPHQTPESAATLTAVATKTFSARTPASLNQFATQTASANPATQVPTATIAPTARPLGEFGLQGKLIFTQGINGLWQIDLATGEEAHWWTLPERAYLGGVAATADGTRLAFAYAPPPPEGTPQLGQTNLYVAPADCFSRPGGCSAHLQLLLASTTQYESYSSPAWSPDGAWLYYSHYKPLFDEQEQFTGVLLNIERISATGDGLPEVVIEDGMQPSLSSDGARIAYIGFEFETYAQSLWVANADGSAAKELLSGAAFYAIAAPRLSPDGALIAFAASGPLQPSPAAAYSWLDWFAVKAVSAHGPPWEIWTIPVEGGPPTQLTQLASDSPQAAWSPDGKQLAVLRPGGVILLGDGEPRFLGEALGHGELIWTRP